MRPYLIVLVAGFVSVCGGVSDLPTLNVLTYGYLPRPQGVANYLQENFNSSTMRVNVSVSGNVTYSLYDTPFLTKLFSNDSDSPDVVEVDSLVAPWLASMGLITPIPDEWLDKEDVLPYSVTGATIPNFGLAGIPTWICSYFLISLHVNVTNMTSQEQLLAALKDQPFGSLASMSGAGNVPFQLYLSALATVNPDAILNGKMYELPPNATALQVLSNLLSLCETESGSNPCLSSLPSSYCFNYTKTVDLLVEGRSKIFVGFGEELYYICEQAHAQVAAFRSPILLGPSRQTMWFTDIFVINARKCGGNPACVARAKTFIDFATSLDVRVALAFNLDDSAPNSLPRFLMPASKAFWNLDAVSSNSNYLQMKNVVLSETSVNFPATANNTAYALLRDAVREAVNATCEDMTFGSFL